MSINLITKAWDLDLPTAEKFVLIALADNASDEGICWPSVRRIARKVSMNPRAVIRIIDRLERAGIVVTEEKGGGRKSNRYSLHLEAGKVLPAFVPSHASAKQTPGQETSHEQAPLTIGETCPQSASVVTPGQPTSVPGSHEPSNNHKKRRQTEPGTLKGVITDVKKTPTRTGISRVVFKIGDINCKAFGRAADILADWNGVNAELTGKFETSQYGVEFNAEHGRGLDSTPIPAKPCDVKTSADRSERPFPPSSSKSNDDDALADNWTFEDLERLYNKRFEKKEQTSGVALSEHSGR